MQEKTFQLQIINTGLSTAQENMKIDCELLNNLQENPILHFYRWASPSLTYGYFINPKDWFDLDAANQYGLDFAKRPTGGGSLFHIWDLAFSFLLPATHPHFSQNTLENYHFVNSVVATAFRETFGSQEVDLAPQNTHSICERFCMANPSRYDVMHNGKKIAGSAQRKTKRGYLHQGSISLMMPDFSLIQRILRFDVQDPIIMGMKQCTFAPLQTNDVNSLEQARNQMEHCLERLLKEKLI